MDYIPEGESDIDRDRAHNAKLFEEKKKNNEIISNPPKMIDMDENPLIDVSMFEEARFYRPMMGKTWRMFPVETHRGCPYKCAYCNSPSQMAMYRLEQNTFRLETN